MTTYADKISLRELIELVRQNDIDVPEMQRTFAQKPSWVVRLIDSMYHDIPIGQVLIWLPDDGHRPTAGRYQRTSSCNRWILDGQQRITALLAALGMRPPWIPEDRWNRMVRQPLQVAVGARRDGQLTFRALHPDVPGAVALGDLLLADQVADVLGPADLLSADIVQKYCALREKLLNSEIALAYLPGDYRTAALGFTRRNQKSSTTALRREELSLCLLGAIHPELQREHIDPLLHQAQQQNLGRVVDRRRVSRVLEDLLPASPHSKAADNGRLTADDVEHAANRVTAAFRNVLTHLRECGINHEELLPSPSIVLPLAHLFDLFPHARQDDFPERWMTHVIARHQYKLHGHAAEYDSKRVRSAGRYDEVKAALVAPLPEGPMTEFVEDRLFERSTHTNFGDSGFLNALAATAQTDGPVTDLADPGVVFPDPRLRLRQLCCSPARNLLVHFAFMTEETAERILAHGGWTVGAYEELRCSEATLAAQSIPPPQPHIPSREIGSWLLKNRASLLAGRIERYRQTVGALSAHV